MKIGGVEIKGPNLEILVLPRPSGDIVFKAETVKNFKEFDALVPVPKAPGVRTREGFKPNENDPNYLQLMDGYGNQRIAYLVIKSLVPSDIEWSKVKLADPTTWQYWSEELADAGLSDLEINRVVTAVMAANNLDESKLEAARKAFALGQALEASESSGQDIEQAST